MGIEHRLDFFEIASKYTNLRHRGGGKYYGLCPLHPEDTPSFHIDTNLGVFYCFGCNTGGNIYQFISLVEHVPINQVGEILREKFGIDVKTKGEKKYEDDHDLFSKFLKLLSKYNDTETVDDFNIKKLGLKPKYPMFYVPNERLLEFTNEVKEKLDIERLITLGIFSRDEEGKLKFRYMSRIIIPIYSRVNRIVGLVGRSLNDMNLPKYLNTKFSKTEHLPFLNEAVKIAKKKNLNTIYIVEGPYDALALIERDIPAASLLGIHFTVEQINLLNSFSVVYFVFDNDDAGTSAYFNVAKTIIKTNRPSFSTMFVFYKDKEDIDEILKKKSFEEFIKTADTKDVYDVFIDAHLRNIVKDLPIKNKELIREELIKRLMKLFFNYRENEHVYNLMLRICERSKYPFDALIRRVDYVINKGLSKAKKDIESVEIDYIPPKERKLLRGVLYLVNGHHDKLMALKRELLLYKYKSKTVKSLVEFFLEERSEISEEEYSLLVETEPEEVDLISLISEQTTDKRSEKLKSIAKRLGFLSVSRALEIEGNIEPVEEESRKEGEESEFTF
ncbi:DNA primase bacterial DnaG type [Thermus phage TMA]|uniref:DNA primase n=1 Tax=Thermus phage TMA TaxID=699370 RepID=UPI00021AAE29|nr:DNA primase [Thermus phage TMA]BAK53711.1 DNA primase bacterial DnaG type [Thermus phage TMA]